MNNKLIENFKSLWTELGRDPSVLDLSKKSDKELEDGIVKLKTIKMSFKILYSQDKGHKLAIALLADAFGDKIQENNEQY